MPHRLPNWHKEITTTLRLAYTWSQCSSVGTAGSSLDIVSSSAGILGLSVRIVSSIWLKIHKRAHVGEKTHLDLPGRQSLNRLYASASFGLCLHFKPCSCCGWQFYDNCWPKDRTCSSRGCEMSRDISHTMHSGHICLQHCRVHSVYLHERNKISACAYLTYPFE